MMLVKLQGGHLALQHWWWAGMGQQTVMRSTDQTIVANLLSTLLLEKLQQLLSPNQIVTSLVNIIVKT